MRASSPLASPNVMGDPSAHKTSPARTNRRPDRKAPVSACTVQDEFAELSIRKRKGSADVVGKADSLARNRHDSRGRARFTQDTRKRLKSVIQDDAFRINHPAIVSAAQSAQKTSPFHTLPVELIWRVLDEVRDNDETGLSEAQKIGSLRSTCRLFAFAALPKLYQHKCMRLRRDSGSPLDLSGLETLCDKLSPGDIERFDLLFDHDATTANRIDLARTATLPGESFCSILRAVRVFVLGHQPVKLRQEQDTSPTSDKESSIVRFRDIAEEHSGYLKQVAAVLGAMSKLQSLTMSSVLHWDEIMPALGCGSGILRDLALVECEVGQQSLQRLLEANKHSLRRLTLARLWMQDRAEIRELMVTVKGLVKLDEFVFVSRRPALCRPPSWQGHREALKEIFGRGSQELPRKAEFVWVKP